MTENKKTDSEFNLTFLRHGESTGNAFNFHQGQSDFPLSSTGEVQVRKLVDRWKAEGVTYDLLISSPLMRARKTAEIISESMHIPVEFDPIWMERDAGLLQGLHEDEVETSYLRPQFASIFQPVGSTGESQWDLYLRAGNALGTLLQKKPGNYLIVSHGALLNMVMFAILGIIPQANYQGPHFSIANTGFSRIVYYPDEHYWFIKEINDHSHLTTFEKNTENLSSE